jgi:hypothetical protein
VPLSFLGTGLLKIRKEAYETTWLSECMYMYTLIVARQRLGKHFPRAMNTLVTMEELLDASFSMGSVSYQSKVGYLFFPELLVSLVISRARILMTCHLFFFM